MERWQATIDHIRRCAAGQGYVEHGPPEFLVGAPWLHYRGVIWKRDRHGAAWWVNDANEWKRSSLTWPTIEAAADAARLAMKCPITSARREPVASSQEAGSVLGMNELRVGVDLAAPNAERTVYVPVMEGPHEARFCEPAPVRFGQRVLDERTDYVTAHPVTGAPIRIEETIARKHYPSITLEASHDGRHFFPIVQPEAFGARIPIVIGKVRGVFPGFVVQTADGKTWRVVATEIDTYTGAGLEEIVRAPRVNVEEEAAAVFVEPHRKRALTFGVAGHATAVVERPDGVREIKRFELTSFSLSSIMGLGRGIVRALARGGAGPPPPVGGMGGSERLLPIRRRRVLRARAREE